MLTVLVATCDGRSSSSLPALGEVRVALAAKVLPPHPMSATTAIGGPWHEERIYGAVSSAVGVWRSGDGDGDPGRRSTGDGGPDDPTDDGGPGDPNGTMGELNAALVAATELQSESLERKPA